MELARDVVTGVGKLAVPPEVLNKPARLSDEEMGVMRTHPEAGVELLRAADLSPLTISVIRDHHERPDGTGYPSGLRGNAIHEVVLPDGRRGVVAAVGPLDPDRPTVRVPCGGAVEEVAIDMTEPPAVLAPRARHRASLPA